MQSHTLTTGELTPRPLQPAMTHRRWLALVLVQAVALGLLAVVAIGRDGASSATAAPPETVALVTQLTQAREACYAAPECPNLDELMALFTPTARRTEIRRDNTVTLLEGPAALRDDHRRVARQFTGRRLETTAVTTQGRNVVVLQRNWDPGAAQPNPFTHVYRIEDGKVAHWTLVAP